MIAALTIKNSNNSWGLKLNILPYFEKSKWWRKGNMWYGHLHWSFSMQLDSGHPQEVTMDYKNSYPLLGQTHLLTCSMNISNHVDWKLYSLNCSVLCCWFHCCSFVLHHQNHHDPRTIPFAVLGCITKTVRQMILPRFKNQVLWQWKLD